MMDKRKLSRPPKRGVGDAVYTGGMAALKAIPYAGGPASEIISYLIARPIDRRRSEWFKELHAALEELQNRGEVDLESLRDSEAFASVTMAATLTALKTHQREKHEALRNCVLNAAVGFDPDDSARQIFIDLVDRYTPIHLKLLTLFNDPRLFPNVLRHYTNVNMGGLLHVMQLAYPELQRQDALVRVVWRDLSANGLIDNVELGLTMSASGCLERRTTPLGTRFLRFVCTSPLAAGRGSNPG